MQPRYPYVSIFNAGKKARELLSETYRKLFANKQVMCVEYTDLSDAQEREIFRRVQLGMALTPAGSLFAVYSRNLAEISSEKLQVTSSPRSSFIRSLLSTYVSPSIESSPTLALIDMERIRASDFRSVANAVFVIQKYSEPGRKGKALKDGGTLSQLEKWLEASDEVPQEQQHHVREVLKTFLAMVISKDPIVKDVFKMRVAPIEFVFVSLLLSVLLREKGMGMNQLKEMAETIRDMRIDVRKHHVDIRANTKVGGTLMEFIRAVSSGLGLGGKKIGVGSGVKRKRMVEEEEEEEGDYVAKKPMTASKTPQKTTNSASTPTPASPPPQRCLAPVRTISKSTAAVTLPTTIIAAKVPDAARRSNSQGSVMQPCI
jgi:hypothetical protein